ncbi:A24 family peptidase [Paracoccus salsus]|uniref:A24 family peptidase n=1 Tax=Paracoccus salsus TaxID=2911061 RepID=UPI001F3A1D16|nr:prepilin peptidase [Paracoccus salsus]MCF3972582.1 prepilin peptidase [Paracoccus salsus]
MSFSTLLLLFFPVMLIHAGVGDLRTMRIPNHLILILFAGYFVAIPLVGLTLQDIIWSIAAASVAFAAGFWGFCHRWMGGGDVKLLTVAALWLGADNLAPFILYTSLFGAMLTILLMVFRRGRLPESWRRRDWIARLHQRDAGVPYGVAIAAAGITIYMDMPGVAAWL